MKKNAFVFMGMLALAGCQTTGMPEADFDAPVRAGDTIVRFNNPSTEKWAIYSPKQIDPSKPIDPRWLGYGCKMPACTAPTLVTYTIENSPTSKPIPEGVLAVVKGISEKRPENSKLMVPPQLLPGKFLSAQFIFSRESNGKIEYIVDRTGYVGNKAFRIVSRSLDESSARKYMEEWMNAFEYKTGS